MLTMMQTDTWRQLSSRQPQVQLLQPALVLTMFVFITQAYCPEPVVPHGTVTAPRGNSQGAWVKVKCHKGYTWVGPARSICTVRHIWNPPMSKCYDKCRKPIIENSAEVTGPEILEHDDVIQVICRNRFSIANQGIIRCWNGSFIWGRDWAKKDEKIECKASCPDPVDLHGLITKSNGNEVSSLATIQCREGYTCKGRRTCQSLCGPKGEWFPDFPQCIANCPSPNISNARSQPSPLTYENGRQYIVSCKFGFYIPYNGHLVCYNGSWTWLMSSNDEAIQCRPVQCNENHIQAKYVRQIRSPKTPLHGDTAEIICIDEYRISNNGVVRCYNGEWVWDNMVFVDRIECTKAMNNSIEAQFQGSSLPSKGSSRAPRDQLHNILTPAVISIAYLFPRELLMRL